MFTTPLNMLSNRGILHYEKQIKTYPSYRFLDETTKTNRKRRTIQNLLIVSCNWFISS